MFIFFMSFLLMLHSHSQSYDKDTIQLVLVQVYLLLTSAVRPPHDLLGYRVPKTVHLPFGHLILHWDLFGHSLLLPALKVQDLPNTEHE